VVVSDSSTNTTSADAIKTMPAEACTTAVEIFPGWNLLNLVRQPFAPFKASDWAADINTQGGTITRIQKWDGTGWAAYSVGAPFGDFDIEPGKGYFVYSQERTTWMNSGNVPPCPMDYHISAGWNLTGFPLGTHTTATALADAINKDLEMITKIQSWDGSGWQAYSVDAPFGDFEINRNNGLFLFAQTPGTFTQACDGDGSVCGAYVAPDVWKEFDCYNLAAIGKETGADPFTPSWELIGGYWQWGRKGPDPGEWYNTNTANFAHGPTGPGAADANDGAVTGWDGTDAPDGAWSDASKTANDPCPAGYRVPTKSDWDGVVANNTQSTVGTWSSFPDDPVNYSVALKFGDKLMLPAAGIRDNFNGALSGRGYEGHWWSSSESSASTAWHLYLPSNSSSATMYAYGMSSRSLGQSVRCVAE